MTRGVTPGLLTAPGSDVYQLFEYRSPLLGRAYLVVVPLDEHSGMVACEAHLLVEKSTTNSVRALRFRVGSSDFRLDDEEQGVVDIVGIARSWAEGDLGEEQLSVARQEVKMFYPMPPTFSESTTPLSLLWLSGFLPAGLRSIAERTASKPLRNYLERLFKVPPVVTKPF